jgi:phytoene dehydrogenase-like protein
MANDSTAPSPATNRDLASSRGQFDVDVVIVGAGLAGLACAVALTKAGRSVQVVEASDGVGGRVRTDVVDGFLLDRGFQVLLTAYPAAKELLDYAKLDLRPFVPGARVRAGGRFHDIADPIRRPLSAIGTATAPIGSLADKARIAKMRLGASRSTPESAWTVKDQTTRDRLRADGFSSTVIDRFFQPLYAGIFLDPTLSTSSRMFAYVFHMLATGDNAVPAKGMSAIPEQLAAMLPPGTIRLRARVGAVSPGRVTLIDAATVTARVVVVATEGPHAAKLLADMSRSTTNSQSATTALSDLATDSNPVSCVYFAAPTAPVDQAVIVLNGEPGTGPVNNLAVMSKVSAAYAPPGHHLVAATVLGSHTSSEDADLEKAVRSQMATWFGGARVDRWDHLRTYHIPHAQPKLENLSPPERSVTVAPGLFVTGDHRDQASIQGALASGQRCATAVLASLRAG